MIIRLSFSLSSPVPFSRRRSHGLRLALGFLSLGFALFLPSIIYALHPGTNLTVKSLEPKNTPVTVSGKVVDARTGEPVAKVRITVVGTSASAITDENGLFTLRDLRPGEVELYVTTVGYGLVKKKMEVKNFDEKDIVIVLNQESASLEETVTVTAAPYDVSETNAVSEQTLNKTELQDLSKVLISDPIRAVQNLPGVAANDDLRAEFALRGAEYRRVGVFYDGVLMEDFLHFDQSNADERITFSIINSDTINEVSLFPGAFPARFGDATAGVLKLETRDGNRVKPAFRISTGLQLGTSGVADGPFANKKGAWLFAARSTLLDYISRLISKAGGDDPDTGKLDFSDFSGKVIYDLSQRHAIGISAFSSFLRFDDNPAANQILNPNQTLKGKSDTSLVNGFWNYTPGSRLFVQTRFFGTRTNAKRTNQTGSIIGNEHRTQLGVRSDLNFLVRPSHRIEGGISIRSLSASNIENEFLPARSNLETYNKTSAEEGYYLQDTYTNERLGLSFTGGARIDHSGLNGQTVISPRSAFTVRFASDWIVRAGVGRYYQFPNFEPLFGQFGNSNLRAEQSTHYNVSVERTFGDRYRALAEIYDREDDHLLFSLSEPRLAGSGGATFSQLPFQNSLQGHARGIELTFQRRSANRLSGWLSYSYAVTRYRESQSGLNFVSDFDQRHTLNAYGSYRFTPTFNFSGQWHYGSGFPIPGFFRFQGVDLFLSDQRNTLRAQSYSRLDLRLNKAFLFSKWKLTLSGEVLNVLNHENLRPPIIDGFNSSTGRVFYHFGDNFHVLPALGVAIEF